MMMIKLLLFVFLIIPFSVNAQEVIQITCDEEIKLEIDEVNMTNEEIVKAKDLYFKKLFAPPSVLWNIFNATRPKLSHHTSIIQ